MGSEKGLKNYRSVESRIYTGQKCKSKEGRNQGLKIKAVRMERGGRVTRKKGEEVGKDLSKNVK